MLKGSQQGRGLQTLREFRYPLQCLSQEIFHFITLIHGHRFFFFGGGGGGGGDCGGKKKPVQDAKVKLCPVKRHTKECAPSPG